MWSLPLWNRYYSSGSHLPKRVELFEGINKRSNGIVKAESRYQPSNAYPSLSG